MLVTLRFNRALWSSSLSDRTKKYAVFLCSYNFFDYIHAYLNVSLSCPHQNKKGENMEFFHKHKKIILIVLIVLFIELSGYGILASLSRLLNAL